MPTDVGAGVELVRGQIGRALALRLPVHRVEAGVGEGAADRLHGRLRQRRAGVGQEAQVGQLAVGEPAQREQHLKDGRDARQAGDVLRLEQLHDPAREGEVRLQDQRGPDPHAHQELVEPVVEGQRQHAEDDVRLLHLQVLDDRVGGEGHVGVGQRDPLRVAGRARRVDHRGEIDADRARRRLRRRRRPAPRRP